MITLNKQTKHLQDQVIFNKNWNMKYIWHYTELEVDSLHSQKALQPLPFPVCHIWKELLISRFEIDRRYVNLVQVAGPKLQTVPWNRELRTKCYYFSLFVFKLQWMILCPLFQYNLCYKATNDVTKLLYQYSPSYRIEVISVM